MIRDAMLKEWSMFFAAQVGAGATLTGLVFVALSINLKEILAGPGLPSRAGEALILLMQPVVIGAVALIPGQSLTALGVEVLVIGALTSYQITKMIWNGRALLVQQPRAYMATRIGFAEAATLPSLVAAGMLIGGLSAGLYVQTAALMICILDGVLDAWVLLVEILR
jgi:modulator of FtsH protease